MISLSYHFNPLSIIQNFPPSSLYCPSPQSTSPVPCLTPGPPSVLLSSVIEKPHNHALLNDATQSWSQISRWPYLQMRVSYSLLSFLTVATSPTFTTVHKSPRLMNLPALFTQNLITYHTEKVFTPVNSSDKSSLKVAALSPQRLTCFGVYSSLFVVPMEETLPIILDSLLPLSFSALGSTQLSF